MSLQCGNFPSQQGHVLRKMQFQLFKKTLSHSAAPHRFSCHSSSSNPQSSPPSPLYLGSLIPPHWLPLTRAVSIFSHIFRSSFLLSPCAIFCPLGDKRIFFSFLSLPCLPLLHPSSASHTSVALRHVDTTSCVSRTIFFALLPPPPAPPPAGWMLSSRPPLSLSPPLRHLKTARKAAR